MSIDAGRKLALRGAVAMAALLVALGLLAATGSPAEAQIDISGDWILDIQGGYGDSCAVALQQSGTELTAEIDCSIGSGTLSGTIDPSTGSLSMAGNVGPFGVDLQGVASQDGQSISGTWDILSYEISGTFSGTRGVAPPTPTPGGPGPLSGPADLEFAAGTSLPDTGSGPNDGGGNRPLVVVLGAGALLLAAGSVVLRLGTRWRDAGP